MISKSMSTIALCRSVGSSRRIYAHEYLLLRYYARELLSQCNWWIEMFIIMIVVLCCIAASLIETIHFYFSIFTTPSHHRMVFLFSSRVFSKQNLYLSFAIVHIELSCSTSYDSLNVHLWLQHKDRFITPHRKCVHCDFSNFVFISIWRSIAREAFKTGRFIFY